MTIASYEKGFYATRISRGLTIWGCALHSKRFLSDRKVRKGSQAAANDPEIGSTWGVLLQGQYQGNKRYKDTSDYASERLSVILECRIKYGERAKKWSLCDRPNVQDKKTKIERVSAVPPWNEEASE